MIPTRSICSARFGCRLRSVKLVPVAEVRTLPLRGRIAPPAVRQTSARTDSLTRLIAADGLVKRIFLTLALVGTVFLIVTFVMGLSVGDPRDLDERPAVSNHMQVALGATIFALFVHAITLTYFMGTGRWMEETSKAYRLSPDYCQASSRLKYSVVPGLFVCLVALVITGALGAATDPISRSGFEGWFGLSGSQIHFLAACLTLAINMLVNLIEFQAISKNSLLVERAMSEVQQIRREHGLPV